VLDSEVNSLFDVSVLDLLVDDDTNRALRNVVDDASLSVVNLMGHSLLHGTVGLDIDNVSDFVLAQVGRKLDHTLLAKISGEGIPGTGSQSSWMAHRE